MKRLNDDTIMFVLLGVVISGFLSMASVCSAAEGTWTRKSDMPTERCTFSTGVVNERIYAIGGAKGRTDALRRVPLQIVEEYHPATDTWTRKADMPTARNALCVSVVDGKIYAIGGLANPTGMALATVEEYDTGLGVLIADFNGDGVVDLDDLVILIENWGTDEPLCDIAPPPDGDGVVDVLDLELFLSYWEQENMPAVTENDE